MTARPLNVADPAGIGMPHRLVRPVTAVGKDRYSTGTILNHAGTTSPYNRTKTVNDLMSVEEFNDQLGDLVGSAILNRLPAFSLASALLRATCAISAAAEIDIEDLLNDLNACVAEMNSDYRAHLH